MTEKIPIENMATEVPQATCTGIEVNRDERPKGLLFTFTNGKIHEYHGCVLIHEWCISTHRKKALAPTILFRWYCSARPDP